MKSEIYVVDEIHSHKCVEDVSDKVLIVFLNPNESDISPRYLERDKDYNVNGNLLTFIYPEIEIGDNIEIAVVQGRVLSAEEYRELLCDR
jgi:hypothetical protein